MAAHRQQLSLTRGRQLWLLNELSSRKLITKRADKTLRMLDDVARDHKASVAIPLLRIAQFSHQSHNTTEQALKDLEFYGFISRWPVAGQVTKTCLHWDAIMDVVEGRETIRRKRPETQACFAFAGDQTEAETDPKIGGGTTPKIGGGTTPKIGGGTTPKIGGSFDGLLNNRTRSGANSANTPQIQPPTPPREPAGEDSQGKVVVVGKDSSEEELYEPSKTEPSPDDTRQPEAQSPQPIPFTDVRWEVVVEKLHDYGCLSRSRIEQTIAAAKANGSTAERVMALVDWAARCVVDEPGHELQKTDGSGQTAAVTRRVYAWSVGFLLYRIANDNLRISSVEGWPKKNPEYDDALRRQAARSAPAVAEARRSDTFDLAKSRKRQEETRAANQQIEAIWGPIVDAMNPEERQALVDERFPRDTFLGQHIRKFPESIRSRLIHELNMRPPREVSQPTPASSEAASC